ncbi:MAG TPA: hypothetical protein VMA53_25115 [Stellaceae bacterium]|nr:hypothetical protein [Stellaceae bacterium]
MLHGEETRHLRLRAAQFRKLADQYETAISPKLRQIAEHLDAWADELDRRQGNGG